MFSVTYSPEIVSRAQFAALCNARRLYRAVEVGTDLGAFACQFLSQWDGEILWCVDPYLPYDEMRWPRQADYLLTLAQLAKFPAGKARLLRMKSLEAAKMLRQGRKDDGNPYVVEFVYIDGNHDAEHAYRDIHAWWDLLYPTTGILAGHDFDEEHREGVVRAVLQFALKKGLHVRLTREGETASSWYIYKQEPWLNMLRLHTETRAMALPLWMTDALADAWREHYRVIAAIREEMRRRRAERALVVQEAAP